MKKSIQWIIIIIDFFINFIIFKKIEYFFTIVEPIQNIYSNRIMDAPQSLKLVKEWSQQLVEKWSKDKCPSCGKLFHRSAELQTLLDKKASNKVLPALISWIEDLLRLCTVSAGPDKWSESPLVKKTHKFLVQWHSFHAQGSNATLLAILYLCAETLWKFPPHFAVCGCKEDYSNVPKCPHPGCSRSERGQLLCEIHRSAAHSTRPVPNHRQIAYRNVFNQLSWYARELRVAHKRSQRNAWRMNASGDQDCSSFDDL
jgi:hypothetical protein